MTRSSALSASAPPKGVAPSALGYAVTIVGVILQTAWSVGLLVGGSNVGMDFDTTMLLMLGTPGLLLFWGIRWWVHAREPQAKKSRKWMLAPATGAVLLLIVGLDGPFWVRFWLSHGPLDRFADEVTNDDSGNQTFDPPRTVGLFGVRKAEVDRDGVVRLDTGSGFLGNGGIAFCPGGAPTVPGDVQYSHLAGSWWTWWRGFD